MPDPVGGMANAKTLFELGLGEDPGQDQPSRLDRILASLGGVEGVRPSPKGTPPATVLQQLGTRFDGQTELAEFFSDDSLRNILSGQSSIKNEFAGLQLSDKLASRQAAENERVNQARVEEQQRAALGTQTSRIPPGRLRDIVEQLRGIPGGGEAAGRLLDFGAQREQQTVQASQAAVTQEQEKVDREQAIARFATKLGITPQEVEDLDRLGLLTRAVQEGRVEEKEADRAQKARLAIQTFSLEETAIRGSDKTRAEKEALITQSAVKAALELGMEGQAVEAIANRFERAQSLQDEERLIEDLTGRFGPGSRTIWENLSKTQNAQVLLDEVVGGQKAREKAMRHEQSWDRFLTDLEEGRDPRAALVQLYTREGNNSAAAGLMKEAVEKDEKSRQRAVLAELQGLATQSALEASQGDPDARRNLALIQSRVRFLTGDENGAIVTLTDWLSSLPEGDQDEVAEIAQDTGYFPLLLANTLAPDLVQTGANLEHVTLKIANTLGSDLSTSRLKSELMSALAPVVGDDRAGTLAENLGSVMTSGNKNRTLNMTEIEKFTRAMVVLSNNMVPRGTSANATPSVPSGTTVRTKRPASDAEKIGEVLLDLAGIKTVEPSEETERQEQSRQDFLRGLPPATSLQDPLEREAVSLAHQEVFGSQEQLDAKLDQLRALRRESAIAQNLQAFGATPGFWAMQGIQGLEAALSSQPGAQFLADELDVYIGPRQNPDINVPNVQRAAESEAFRRQDPQGNFLAPAEVSPKDVQRIGEEILGAVTSAWMDGGFQTTYQKMRPEEQDALAYWYAATLLHNDRFLLGAKTGLFGNVPTDQHRALTGLLTLTAQRQKLGEAKRLIEFGAQGAKEPSRRSVLTGRLGTPSQEQVRRDQASLKTINRLLGELAVPAAGDPRRTQKLLEVLRKEKGAREQDRRAVFGGQQAIDERGFRVRRGARPIDLFVPARNP